MKRKIQLLVFLLAIVLAGNTYAQKSIKIGHFDSSELIQKMPEGEAAQVEMQKYIEELQEEAEAMQKEFQRLYTEYQAKESQLSDLLKQSKQRELQSVEERFREFEQSAQIDIQMKREEVMSKITNKIKEAVAEIAKENKFTYILESAGILWYADDSEDITPLILKKLNIN